MTPTGAVTEFQITTPNSWPFGIVQSSDGLFDFSAQMGDYIGTFDPADPSVMAQSNLDPPSGPSGVASMAYSTNGSAPGGWLAFAAADGNYIGVAQTGPPKIQFTKTCSPDPVAVGQELTCTFTVTNNTIGDANLYVSDQFDPAQLSLPDQPGWHPSLPFVLSEGLLVHPGEPRTLLLKFVVNSSGLIQNSAKLLVSTANEFVASAEATVTANPLF